MDAVREKAATHLSKAVRQRKLAEFGLAEERAVWNIIAPALPQFTPYAYEFCHSDLSGMETRKNELINKWLLTEVRGCEAYIIAFRRVTIPVGWPKFQNPISHLRSYGFAEKGRLSLVHPFIFADFFQEVYIRQESLKRIKTEFAVELRQPAVTPVTLVMKLLTMFADSNAGALKGALTSDEQTEVAKRLVQCRSFFQRFARLTGTKNDEDAGEKAIRRPNIHQALHVPQTLKDYATLRNTEVRYLR